MVALQSAVDGRIVGVIGADAVVLGRVAQSYGLPEMARWYYARVDRRGEGAQSTRLLAERWAAELPPAKAAPSAVSPAPPPGR